MIGRVKITSALWEHQAAYPMLKEILGNPIHVSWEPNIYTVTAESELFTEKGILGEKYPLYLVKFDEKWDGAKFSVTASAERITEE